MLYKPKNLYPDINKDVPVLYPEENNGELNFQFTVDGNEKVKYGAVEVKYKKENVKQNATFVIKKETEEKELVAFHSSVEKFKATTEKYEYDLQINANVKPEYAKYGTYKEIVLSADKNITFPWTVSQSIDLNKITDMTLKTDKTCGMTIYASQRMTFPTSFPTSKWHKSEYVWGQNSLQDINQSASKDYKVNMIDAQMSIENGSISWTPQQFIDSWGTGEHYYCYGYYGNPDSYLTLDNLPRLSTLGIKGIFNQLNDSLGVFENNSNIIIPVEDINNKTNLSMSLSFTIPSLSINNNNDYSSYVYQYTAKDICSLPIEYTGKIENFGTKNNNIFYVELIMQKTNSTDRQIFSKNKLIKGSGGDVGGYIYLHPLENFKLTLYADIDKQDTITHYQFSSCQFEFPPIITMSILGLYGLDFSYSSYGDVSVTTGTSIKYELSNIKLLNKDMNFLTVKDTVQILPSYKIDEYPNSINNVPTCFNLSYDINSIMQANSTDTLLFKNLLDNKFSYRIIISDQENLKEATKLLYSDSVSAYIDLFSEPKIRILKRDTKFLQHFVGYFEQQTQNTAISLPFRNFQWKLYKVQNKKNKLFYQTPKIYSQDLQFEYDNLIPGEYIVEAIVEDNYGQIWTGKEPFSVNYEQNDLYLNLQTELDKENTGVKLKWDKPAYGVAVDQGTNSNLTLTEDLFAWMTEDQKLNYKENLIKDDVLDLTYNEFRAPVLTNTVTYLFNSEPYLNINNTKMCYFSFLGQIYLDTSRKEILIPFSTFNDFFGEGIASHYYTQLRIQKDTNDEYRPYIQTIFGDYESIEFENFESPYTETGCYDFYCQYNFKNGTYKIATKKQANTDWITAEIKTNLIPKTSIAFYTNLKNISAIDYVLITSKETCNEQNIPILGKDISYEFENSEDTIYLNFNSIDNIWNVKDPAATTTFTGYIVKRYNPLTQKVLDMGQYYFTKENTEEERRFIDYSLPYNEEVKYLIYPQGNETITDEEGNKTSQEFIFSPIYSDSIKGDWDKWCLFTTRGPAPKKLDGENTNGYNENVLLVDKVFFFEMNVETGNMKNNTDFSVVKNFTPYPHIQRSPSNYWSGQLKGLLGRLAIDDCTFKQTPTMLQEIKELTQNTSRKFLKDRDGNFWEVELSSDITIDNNDKLDVQLKTKSFNWAEVGDASNIALISIGPSREDWLLTELGKEQIDISRYTWDDNAIWDENDFWTESE